MKKIFPFIFILTLAACSSPEEGFVTATTGQANLIEGANATAADPISRSAIYLQARGLKEGFSVCTAEILSPTVILTAGHCVVDKSDPTKKFALPAKNLLTLDRSVNPAAAFEADSVIINPIYLQFLQHEKIPAIVGPAYNGRDLAVIRLKKPLPAKYQPFKLSLDLQEAFASEIHDAGFGLHSQDHKVGVDGILRHGKITLDLRDTNESFWTLPDSTEKFTSGYPTNRSFARVLKASKKAANAGICHGDSGGPLYYEKNGEVYLVAVNSSIASVKNDPCAVEGEAEYATLLKGENLKFVTETFKALTSQNLLEQNLPAAAQDADQFDFYFGKSRSPRANSFVDLNLVAIEATFPDRADPVTLLVPNLAAARPCEVLPKKDSLVLDSSYALTMEDGSTSAVIRVMQTEADGRILPKFNLETRYKVKGPALEAVVLTPNGFLANTIPKFQCRFGKSFTEFSR
jgi:hypothetical protein